MNRDGLIKALEEKFPNKNFMTTEEFYGSREGQMKGVWTSGEDEQTVKSGLRLFDYYAESESYVFGVEKTFHNWLEKRGWYCEWHDAGTMMIWEA